MSRKNTHRWKPTTLQIDENYLLYLTDLLKRCVKDIKELDCPLKYLADMLSELANAIFNSYQEVKDNFSSL